MNNQKINSFKKFKKNKTDQTECYGNVHKFNRHFRDPNKIKYLQNKFYNYLIK